MGNIIRSVCRGMFGYEQIEEISTYSLNSLIVNEIKIRRNEVLFKKRLFGESGEIHQIGGTLYSSYLFVGLGGALGAITRVFLARFLPHTVAGIPFTILFVNILGCLALGVLTGVFSLFWQASMNARHFLVQGLLGGFTTFSAFSLEFSLLYEKGQYGSALIYGIASVALSILAFLGGLKLIRLFSPII